MSRFFPPPDWEPQPGRYRRIIPERGQSPDYIIVDDLSEPEPDKKKVLSWFRKIVKLVRSAGGTIGFSHVRANPKGD